MDESTLHIDPRVGPYPEPETPMPDEEELAHWIMDPVAEATDGARARPPSWLLRLGLI